MRLRARGIAALAAVLIGVAGGLAGVPETGGDRSASAASATAPTVTIDVPVTSSTECQCLRGPVTLAATAAASSGRTIASVEFQSSPAGSAAWSRIALIAAPPYQTDFDTGALQGPFDIRAVVTDSTGEQQTSAVARDRVLANGATYVGLAALGGALTGTVKLSATPELGGNVPSAVTFQRSPAGAETWTTVATAPPDVDADGNPTGSFTADYDTKGSADGTYDFRLLARDDFDSPFVARPARDVTVDNTAPTVAVSLGGGTLSGLVSLTADAQDAGSGITSVRFERTPAGASTWTRIGTVTRAPFSLGFDTRLLDDGLYDVRAVARDRAGLTTVSRAVRAEISNPGRRRFDQLAIENIVAPAHNISLLGSIAGSPQHETWAYGFTNGPPAEVDGARLPYTIPGSEQLVLLRYTDDGGWQVADVLRNADGTPFPLARGVSLTVTGQMTASGEAWLAVGPRLAEQAGAQPWGLFHRVAAGRFLLDGAATDAMGSLLRPASSLGSTRLRVGETADGRVYGMLTAPQQTAQVLRLPSGGTTIGLVARLDFGSLAGGTWTKETAALPPAYVPRRGDALALAAADATGPDSGWGTLTLGNGSPFVLGRFAGATWTFVKSGLDALDLTDAFSGAGAVTPTSLVADSRAVWSTATVPGGTVVSRYDIAAGGVSGSWCTPAVAQRSLGCAQVLDPNRPATVPSDVFDTPDGDVGVALQNNVLGIFSRGDFASVPAPGFRGGPGKALFTAPDEGWLAGDDALGRVVAGTARSLLSPWPQANRSPLLSVALPPGSEAGVGQGGALAVGLDGSALHYDGAAGWLPDATPTRARRIALRSVAFSAPGTAFAVGQLGTILRWNGTEWTEDPQSVAVTQAQLDAVAFRSDGQGWAVGSGGTILHFDGQRWAGEAAPAAFDGLEITSVAVAGNDVFAVAGGTLIQRGADGRWQPVDAGDLPDPAPADGSLRLVAGLPDGGVFVAGRAVAMARQGAGKRFEYSSQPIEGTAVALAAFREDGDVRALVSLGPDAGVGFPAGDGELMRQTATGWQDLSRTQYPGRGVLPDGAVKVDPVLGVAADRSGAHAWAVGGYAGTPVDGGQGSSQVLPARPAGWRTASIWRYDPGGGAQSPAVREARLSVPARPKVVSFAFFSSPMCRSQCAAVRDAQPDVNLRAAAGQVATYAKEPGGPAFAVLGGNARGPILDDDYQAGNSAADFARLPDLLSPLGRLPLFAAFGPRDAVPGQDDPDGPWAGVFGASPPPFGSGPAAPGIDPVDSGAPTGAVHRYYAFDARQNGGKLRVIVLDNSKGNLEAGARGQTDWLDAQLAAANAAGLPIVAVVSQPLRLSAIVTPPDVEPCHPATIDTPSNCDAEDVAGKLATARVLAVFSPASSATPRTQTNQLTLVPARPLDGAARIPEYEGATLGYQQAQNNGVVWYFASVDTTARTVDVQAIPIVDSLALRPLRGVSAARSSTLAFDAVGRRPQGSLATTPIDDTFPGIDNYVSIPAPPCTTCIVPTYAFTSSDPTIGDFVTANSAGSSYPKLNVNGKPTPDPQSGLFCAFNEGTTTISVTSGLLSSSVPVTVRPGDIGRPCGTVFRSGVGRVVFVPSTKQVRQAAAPSGTSAPPPAASPAPAAAPASLPPVSLPPPPPSAPAAKPPVKPTPQPAAPLALFGGLLAAAPQLTTNAAVSPPPPPPTFFANPIPPGGATVRVQEEKREEEAAPESSAAFSRYSSDDHLPVEPFIFGVMLIAALAGVSIRLPRRRGPAYSTSRVRYPDRRDPSQRRTRR